MTRIIGILNLTRDSFSDGGRYLDPEAAVEHALAMVRDGAGVIDIGAESTHPEAEDVSADEEIARLAPVMEALAPRRETMSFRISVDTCKPAVMRRVSGPGVDMINDVNGLRDPACVAAVADGDAKLIVMHSRSPTARAQRAGSDQKSIDIVEEVLAFFDRRIAELKKAGIARERLILDPGMGFFLGPTPGPSVAVLAGIGRLIELGLPVCVSVSRKSFIGALLAEADGPRAVAERGAGTLAAELWCHQAGVQYLRTHDVRATRDAIAVYDAIKTEPRP